MKFFVELMIFLIFIEKSYESEPEVIVKDNLSNQTLNITSLNDFFNLVNFKNMNNSNYSLQITKNASLSGPFMLSNVIIDMKY